LPNELGQKHLELEVNFDYKKKNYNYLKQAISNGQALTYKITQRLNGKWYVFVSFSIENDCNDQFSSLGIDINYNLIATCLIKPDGNPEKFIDYKFDFENLNKNQIKQKLCDISEDIISQAKQNNKNIIIENLDLDKCKATSDNKISNRKIHMIAYSKFIGLLKSKAVKSGVLIIETNPAFTSVIAKLKYKAKLGRSVHSCASFTIGRRGMNFKEKIPSKLHSLLYGKDLMKPNWKKWSILSKKSTTVLNNSDSTLSPNHFLSELLGDERENKQSLIFNPMSASHDIGTVY
jgi:IS605 OrfB family transposase